MGCVVAGSDNAASRSRHLTGRLSTDFVRTLQTPDAGSICNGLRGSKSTMARKKKKGSVTGQLVLAARSARTALLHSLDTTEIYPGQDNVLITIGKGGGITLRDLAERLAVRPPTVT